MKTTLVGLMLLCVCGCGIYNPNYETYWTYAQTRKIVDSPTYPVFKSVWAPLAFVPETAVSPVTVYVDAVKHPPRSMDQHVYLSYVGFRTMRNAMALNDDRVDKPVMLVAWGLVTVMDTALFPLAGLIDVTWIVSRPTPEDNFGKEHGLRMLGPGDTPAP